MKVESPESWIVILVGTVPPDALVEQVGATVLSAITCNLPLTQFLKGSTVLVTEEAPIDLLQRIALAVQPKTGSKPSLM